MEAPYDVARPLEGRDGFYRDQEDHLSPGGNIAPAPAAPESAHLLDYYGVTVGVGGGADDLGGGGGVNSGEGSTPWSSATAMLNFSGPLGGDVSLEESSLPKEMLFTDDSLVSVIAYTVLFVIAALGNTTVFVTLFRNRHRKSRVNLFIMHLSIADLIVAFIMLPIEIGWHLTVSWRAGDVGCRLFMFLRAFGFYLSSFVLIAISLDRYFAILHPLSLTDAGKRGKIMLFFAWIFSAIASCPQSVIFHQEEHPHYPWFKQCVTFNFFPTPAHELAYNLFNIITVYGLPLVVIVIAYSLILWEMSKKTRESRDQVGSGTPTANQNLSMRRSGVGRIEKAKTRTLKMTIVIVLVFIMCWTPYFVISAWWWFDRDSASKLDTKVQRGLFIFAVSNSCMDPIVYGVFAINFVKEFKRCCCFRRRRLPQHQTSRRVTNSLAKDPRNGCTLQAEEKELSSAGGGGGRAPSRTGSASSSQQERSRGGLYPHRAPLLTETIGDSTPLNGQCGEEEEEGEEGVGVVGVVGVALSRKPTPPHIAGTYRPIVDNKQYARL